MKQDALKIDAEFSQLLSPLSDDEMTLLKESLFNHGCLSPLVTWKGILVDGHNRYELCKRLKIPFKTTSLALKTREEVYNWIIDNQLARRNIAPDMASYLRGKRYIAEEAGHGGSRFSSDQNDHLKRGQTAERIGKELGVSAPTIRRDAKFAEAVDTLPADVKRTVLAGEGKATKQELVEVAKIENKKERDKAARAVVAGEKPPPKTAEPEQVKDGTGAVVKDKKLAAVFQSTIVHEWAKLLKQIKREMKAATEMPECYWLALDWQDFERRLNDLRVDVEARIPYALTPPGLPNGKEYEFSTRANKIGFVTKPQYDSWKASHPS